MKYLDDARDVKFNLFEWLDLDALLKSDRYKEFDRDTLDSILDEALKVAKGSVAACNEAGDRIGAKFEAGKVTLAPGFDKAYKDLAAGGWIGPTSSPEFGGMGLPESVGSGISEFIMGANTSMSLTVLLTRGSAHLIESFGTDELKAVYCEKMYSGEWAGTMCLTEPSAGSDLGDIKTKAVKQEDGSYLLSGEKIFITSGDHDLTPNIVHAVLARTPEAPTGPKGLSLFVVPKFRVNADGSLGQDNDVACSNIEHKLGIHGSPTCSLVLGTNNACQGFLLGRERAGLLLMFQMMNAARYEVGLQGIATASAAHQAALAYAKERLQGRSMTNREPQAGQVPIIQHPDVRRSLLLQAAYVQAMRALVSYTGWCMDMAHVTEGEEHDRWQGLVELFTPVCKAWCSDWGFRVTEWALQVFGGYGYTCEYPAEQYLRDAKIASIYEGTNGIQALDLVGRKFRMQEGKPVKHLMGLAGQAAQTLAADPVLGPSAMQLGAAVKALGAVLTEIPAKENAMLLTVLNAVHVLDMLGHVVSGYMLLQQAALAKEKLAAILKDKGVDAADKAAVAGLLKDSGEAAFYHNKVQVAIHFAHRGLPLVAAQAVALRAGEVAPMEAVF
jgi:alkylation response protein AidB-like acyl-CoA dehydrogenase